MYGEAKLAVVVYLWHPKTMASYHPKPHPAEQDVCLFFFVARTHSPISMWACMWPGCETIFHFMVTTPGRESRLRRLPPSVPGGARGGHRPRPRGAEGQGRGRDGVAPPGSRGPRAGVSLRGRPPRFVAAAGDQKSSGRGRAGTVILPRAGAAYSVRVM